MSPLPAPVQAVLELFHGPLAEVRFADVDAAVLASSARTVEAAAVAVADREAELAELKQTLADKQEALLLLTQRALAYARVYAEHDEPLSEQLASITLPRAGKPRKPSTKAPSVDSPASLRDAATAEGVITQEDEDTAGGPAPRRVHEAEASEAEASEPAVSVSRKGKRRSIASITTRDDAQDGSA